MANSVWAVEESEPDCTYCLGVFKTRKAMIRALENKYPGIEITYSPAGMPTHAQTWYSVLNARFLRRFDLTRMKLDEWSRA